MKNIEINFKKYFFYGDIKIKKIIRPYYIGDSIFTIETFNSNTGQFIVINDKPSYVEVLINKSKIIQQIYYSYGYGTIVSRLNGPGIIQRKPYLNFKEEKQYWINGEHFPNAVEYWFAVLLYKINLFFDRKIK